MTTEPPKFGYPRLDFYSVTSTLDIAREHARSGTPNGTLITASHQSAGRGRRGASWHDQPGASALLTYILRPGAGFSPADAWRIPFIASLACALALRRLGFQQTKVKWPNDLVIDGRKVGGLLVETSDGAYLLGIGINVAQESFPGGAEYVLEPVSLRMVFPGQPADLPNTTVVTAAVTEELGKSWERHLFSGAALIEEWRAYQMTGQRQSGVSLDTDESVTGTYVDVRPADGVGLIAPDGADREAALVAVMPTVA